MNLENYGICAESRPASFRRLNQSLPTRHCGSDAKTSEGPPAAAGRRILYLSVGVESHGAERRSSPTLIPSLAMDVRAVHPITSFPLGEVLFVLRICNLNPTKNPVLSPS